MRNPVVSVCVPTYNGGAFLAQTLQSIAAQTFEDYEVVIVDDHSTDDSIAWPAVRGLDPRVKLFCFPNGPDRRARNVIAVSSMRVEWIKFFSGRRDGAGLPPLCSMQRAMAAVSRSRGTTTISSRSGRRNPGFYEKLATLRSVLPGTYAARRYLRSGARALEHELPGTDEHELHPPPMFRAVRCFQLRDRDVPRLGMLDPDG